MELREKIARTICSFSVGKCCDSEAAPCKVGRGESYNGSNCGATPLLLEAWGHMDEADRILGMPEIGTALRGGWQGIIPYRLLSAEEISERKAGE